MIVSWRSDWLCNSSGIKFQIQSTNFKTCWIILNYSLLNGIPYSTEMQNTSKSFTTFWGKLEWIHRHCDNVIMQRGVGEQKKKCCDAPSFIWMIWILCKTGYIILWSFPRFLISIKGIISKLYVVGYAVKKWISLTQK